MPRPPPAAPPGHVAQTSPLLLLGVGDHRHVERTGDRLDGVVGLHGYAEDAEELRRRVYRQGAVEGQGHVEHDRSDGQERGRVGVAVRADLSERLPDSRVSDVMTTEILAVTPDAPISGIARVLRENAVHRVLVIENGELCGIVSAMDLIALLESRG